MKLISFVTDWLVPFNLFFMTLTLGLGLSLDDFVRVFQRPLIVLTATVSQLVLLPALAIALAAALPAGDELLTGIIILSVCPGGYISNYFVFLARGNVALSVSLTSVSTVLSPFTVPAIVAIAVFVLNLEHTAPRLPAGQIVIQLMILVWLPLAAGLALVKRFGHRVQRWQTIFTRLSVLLMVATLLLASWAIWPEFLANVAKTGLFAIGFTLGAFLVGFVVSRPFPATDRNSVMIEFPARNVGIAVLVGVPIIPEGSFVSFLIVYFILESTILLSLALKMRARGSARTSAGRQL